MAGRCYMLPPRCGPGTGSLMTHQNDASGVLIAGGGVAGLTLAIALRQGLGPSFAVTVADPTLGTSHAGDERASAIVAAARRLLEALEVWPAVAAEAQPILDMVVTDSRLDDTVRPAFLTFAGEIEPERFEWSARVAVGLDALVRDFALDGLTYYYRGLGDNVSERVGGPR